MEHTEMLAAQRKTPLQPEQRQECASQQRPPDIVHQWNFWHGIGDEVSKNLSRCAQHNIKATVKAMRRRIALQKHFVRNLTRCACCISRSFGSAHAFSRRFSAISSVTRRCAGM